MQAWLPSPADMPGWEIIEGPTFYNADNLFEAIDGAAPLFFDYGFSRMLRVVYRPVGQERPIVTADLYEQGSLLEAFGAYGAERSPDSPFEALGAQGYQIGGFCCFYQGRYYAKLNAFSRAAEAVQATRRVAELVAAHLPGTAEAPAELALLPREGLRLNSELYRGANLIGHSFLGAGFEAQYAVAEGSEEYCRLFLSDRGSEEAAAEAYADLREWLAKRGEVGADLVVLQGEAFAGKEPFYGETVCRRWSHYVAGVLGAPRPRAAQLLRALQVAVAAQEGT